MFEYFSKKNRLLRKRDRLRNRLVMLDKVIEYEWTYAVSLRRASAESKKDRVLVELRIINDKLRWL